MEKRRTKNTPLRNPVIIIKGFKLITYRIKKKEREREKSNWMGEWGQGMKEKIRKEREREVDHED